MTERQTFAIPPLGDSSALDSIRDRQLALAAALDEASSGPDASSTYWIGRYSRTSNVKPDRRLLHWILGVWTRSRLVATS
nr:hypothetical protein CFP56_13008 [Quercus suber]